MFVVDALLICFIVFFTFGFKFYKINSAIFISLFYSFVFTGPLLNEDMSVGCMPHKQYKNLTFSLSGKKLSRRLRAHLFINYLYTNL